MARQRLPGWCMRRASTAVRDSVSERGKRREGGALAAPQQPIRLPGTRGSTLYPLSSTFPPRFSVFAAAALGSLSDSLSGIYVSFFVLIFSKLSVSLPQPGGGKTGKTLPWMALACATLWQPCKLEAPGCAAQAAWEVQAVGSGVHPPRTDARCTLAAQRVVSCMTKRGRL